MKVKKTSEKIINDLNLLRQKSSYKDSLSDQIYSHYENIYDKNKSGIFPDAIPELINSKSDCLQCYYAFQLDTYVEGCSHDCIYCWAKFDLSQKGKWNAPSAIPIDFSSLWNLFYIVFETLVDHPLRSILLKKIPLRLGSYSDPFMSHEHKYGLTFEIIKLLNHYQYPCVIVTRSTLVADEKYLNVINPKNFAVQLSIPTLNEKLSKALEPGSPLPKARLETLLKLTEKRIEVVVRINPLFPSHGDGYYSKKTDSMHVVETGFFSLDMITQLAEHGCKSLLVGFVNLPTKTLISINQVLDIDLTKFMKQEMISHSNGSFSYSTQEIRAFYEAIQKKCHELGIQFTTCYLGMSESFFWKDKDLWDHKKDCCNLLGKVENFKATSQDIPIEERITISFPDKSLISTKLLKYGVKMKEFFYRKLLE